MYEIVKMVNGYAIFRMNGTHGFYHVMLNNHTEVIFRTIKAAAKYCEKL